MNASDTSPKFYDPFERSAFLYDRLHAAKNYDDEAACVRHHLELNQNSKVIEFGCGTGEFTRRIGLTCRSMLASDPSQHMLAIARKKTLDDTRTLYGLSTIQGWPNHELMGFNGPCHAGLCMFAAMSYAAAESHRELAKCLGIVRRNLYHSGRFVFDVVNYGCCAAQFHKFDKRQFDVPEIGAVTRTMRKEFHPQTSLVDIAIEFNLESDGGDVPKSWVEYHKMRAFTPTEVAAAAEAAGFTVVCQFAPPDNPPEFDSPTVSQSDYYFWNVLEAR